MKMVFLKLVFKEENWQLEDASCPRMWFNSLEVTLQASLTTKMWQNLDEL